MKNRSDEVVCFGLQNFYGSSPMPSKSNSKLTLTVAAIALLSSASLSVAADVSSPPESDVTAPDPVETLQKIYSGWYIAGRIGGAFADDTRFATLGSRVKSEYDPALNYSAAVGYAFTPQGPVALRTEAEIGRSSFAVNGHAISGVGTFANAQSSGSTTSNYGLINAYADYDLGTLSPFVTVGLGYAQTDFSNLGTSATGQLLNDKSSGVAWQVGAGTSYDLTDSLKLDLGYRYFGIEDIGLTATDATSSKSRLGAHQVILGIRKAF